MTDNDKVFASLLHLAAENGIIVRFKPLRASYARIKGKRIALSEKLDSMEAINYNFAHELAHAYLHYDKGDIMEGDSQQEYEEQADRAAKMLLSALAVD